MRTVPGAPQPLGILPCQEHEGKRIRRPPGAHHPGERVDREAGPDRIERKPGRSTRCPNHLHILLVQTSPYQQEGKVQRREVPDSSDGYIPEEQHNDHHGGTPL